MRNFTSINNFSIRRSLFAAAFAGAACLAPAQSMQLLETITDANDSTLNTMALAISPNHRYLAGSAMNYDTGMMGVFIYDTETETATYVPQDGFMSNRIVAVNDEGFACGNNDYPMTVGPDGVMTKLPLLRKLLQSRRLQLARLYMEGQRTCKPSRADGRRNGRHGQRF